MKYAVAHMDFFNNDLKIIVVKYDDPITALVEGVRTLIKVKNVDIDIETNKWLDSFLGHVNDTGRRIEEIKQEFFNGDQLVAVEEIKWIHT